MIFSQVELRKILLVFILGGISELASLLEKNISNLFLSLIVNLIKI